MRRLAQDLGVEAMSLYTHVRNKEDLLDGMVEEVVSGIRLRPGDGDWRATLRRRILDARQVLKRHAWAPHVIETRAEPAPAILAQFDAVVGIMLAGGFSLGLTHHALHALGSRVLGFTQDLYDDSDDAAADAAAFFTPEIAARFPNVLAIAMAASHEGGLGSCDDDVEFAFALDLILDGLERLRA